MLLNVLYLGPGEEAMEDWDQETLEKVIESKSNEYNKNKPTDIVSVCLLSWCSCKFLNCFLKVLLIDIVATGDFLWIFSKKNNPFIRFLIQSIEFDWY